MDFRFAKKSVSCGETVTRTRHVADRTLRAETAYPRTTNGHVWETDYKLIIRLNGWKRIYFSYLCTRVTVSPQETVTDVLFGGRQAACRQ